MIGSNMIKNIVEDKNITEPAAILNEMNRKLKTTFNHNNIGGKIVDGMEAAICSFDLISGILEFSGAKRPLMLVKKETHEVIKPDSQSISHETPPEFRFTNHIVNLEEDDYIYMFTDGYTDQFGGENGKRFMKSKFIDLINSVREIDMNEQSFYVQQTFETWKGENEQVDDVLVMGFKFK
jgi:serine phosphatase RsbU (regulator of sigma subunit)